MVLLYLEEAHGVKRLTHILEPSYEVSAEAAEVALSAFDRMASGEPIQYIIGKAYFYGRDNRKINIDAGSYYSNMGILFNLDTFDSITLKLTN